MSNFCSNIENLDITPSASCSSSNSQYIETEESEVTISDDLFDLDEVCSYIFLQIKCYIFNLLQTVVADSEESNNAYIDLQEETPKKYLPKPNKQKRKAKECEYVNSDENMLVSMVGRIAEAAEATALNSQTSSGDQHNVCQSFGKFIADKLEAFSKEQQEEAMFLLHKIIYDIENKNRDKNMC